MSERKPGWYYSWRSMITRCENPKAANFKWYGGKGITVCREWHDKDVFEEWALSSGWNTGLWIERIDGSKGYCPENCRWATIREQTRNRVSNQNLTWNGETKCLKDWAVEYGVPWATAYWRYHKGYRFEDIFSNEKHYGGKNKNGKVCSKIQGRQVCERTSRQYSKRQRNGDRVEASAG